MLKLIHKIGIALVACSMPHDRMIIVGPKTLRLNMIAFGLIGATEKQGDVQLYWRGKI